MALFLRILHAVIWNTTAPFPFTGLSTLPCARTGACLPTYRQICEGSTILSWYYDRYRIGKHRQRLGVPVPVSVSYTVTDNQEMRSSESFTTPRLVLYSQSGDE